MEEQEKELQHPSVVPDVVVTEAQLRSFGITDPVIVTEIASKVKKFVKSNGLTVKIQGRDYVEYEGWQFAGNCFGLVPKTLETKNASIYEPTVFKWSSYGKQKEHKVRGIYKYFATVGWFTADGREVARGEAMCSNEEMKKHTFDEYAIMSMAQTRAGGKSARMALGFIMKAAGFEATVAEEMDDSKEKERQAVVDTIPEEIELTILAATDYKWLYNWGSEQTEYHKNLTFRRLLDKKLKELK